MNFDLLKIKNKLLVKYPFFGTIITNVTYNPHNSIDTAGTDGYDIYYKEEFMNGLSEEEQVFILAHEISHIAFNHISRAEGKDMQIWNIVTDAVINAFLENDGLPIPEIAINIPWAKDYNAEELYEVFYKNRQLFQQLLDSLKSQKGKNGNESNQKQKSYGHDSHEEWGKPRKKPDDGKASESDEERRRKKRIENEQEAFNEEGEKKAFNKNSEDRKRQLEKMKEEIIDKQASHQAGNGPSTYIHKLEKIGISRGLIDWRRILRENITFDLDWSYKNAMIEDGSLRANLEEIPMSEVEIVLDTSGSIDEELLKTFLRECKNIMLNAKVKVGCFDTEFYGFHTIRNEKDINDMEYEGGGGTDFDVAVNAFTRRVANRIIFTDGYASLPKNPPKIVWVVIGDHRIEPKNGKVFYINRDDLMRRHRI
ncbi:MAG: hypothetical protein J6X02_04410 [Bacilli bacterium]|nr:hypothetical protein [Bacilli bacterium]